MFDVPTLWINRKEGGMNQGVIDLKMQARIDLWPDLVLRQAAERKGLDKPQRKQSL